MVENPAVTELLEILRRFVGADKDVLDKELFLNIAREVLLGNKATDIAQRFHVEELAIVGVRRKIDEYKIKAQNRTTVLKINDLLRRTKWFDTFTPDWTSPELRAMVVRRGQVPRNYAAGTGKNEIHVKDRLRLAMAQKPK